MSLWGWGGGWGHHYISFGLCFPSQRNTLVLSQHPGRVCLRPAGPSKCTRFLLSGPSSIFSWHPETTGQSDTALCMYRDTKIHHMCTLLGISPRRDSLNSYNVAPFHSLWACLVELYCRTKLRRHAIAAGCVEFLHLVLWCGGGEESQSL